MTRELLKHYLSLGHLSIFIDTLIFYSFILCGSDRFEVCLNDEIIFSGKVYRPDAIDMTQLDEKMKYLPTSTGMPHGSVSKHDIYSLLEYNGYNLHESCKAVTNIDLHFEGKYNIQSIDLTTRTV